MDYSILIKALNSKKQITSLEKDILDTWNELQKNPFDRNSAIHQATLNNKNHPEIFTFIGNLSSTVRRPWNEANDLDIQYNLTKQLDLLIAKEAASQTNRL